jgi:hypothetical protein
MYTNDRLCVRVDDKMTEFFMSEVGARQGEFQALVKLLPLSFSH